MKRILSLLIVLLFVVSIPVSAATKKTAAAKKTVVKKTNVTASTKKATTKKTTAKSAKKPAAKPVKVKAPKNVPVTLTLTPEEVTTGQAITVKAVTQKQGSYLNESVWYLDNVKVIDTKLFSTKLDKASGMYVSVLTLTPTEAKDYNISYSIKMGAGKSAVSFAGTASNKLTVNAPKVTDFTLDTSSMKLTAQVLAEGDTTPKYTLTISNINAIFDNSTTPVPTVVAFEVKDITQPTSDKPFDYSLTYNNITKTFSLSLADFTKLLPQPTPAITVQ